MKGRAPTADCPFSNESPAVCSASDPADRPPGRRSNRGHAAGHSSRRHGFLRAGQRAYRPAALLLAQHELHSAGGGQRLMEADGFAGRHIDLQALDRQPPRLPAAAGQGPGGSGCRASTQIIQRSRFVSREGQKALQVMHQQGEGDDHDGNIESDQRCGGEVLGRQKLFRLDRLRNSDAKRGVIPLSPSAGAALLRSEGAVRASICLDDYGLIELGGQTQAHGPNDAVRRAACREATDEANGLRRGRAWLSDPSHGRRTDGQGSPPYEMNPGQALPDVEEVCDRRRSRPEPGAGDSHRSDP